MKIFLNAYLVNNLGDDLFLKIVLDRYKNHEFYILSKNPMYAKQYPNLHLISNKILISLIRRLNLKYVVANQCDLVLILGGSMFIETKKFNSNKFNYGKNDTYILGCNFGPYYSSNYFSSAKKLFKKAKDVCFREAYSYQLFQDLPNVRWAPDLVFSFPKDKFENVVEEKKVVFSVISCKNKIDVKYEKQYLEKLAEMIHFFKMNNFKITLMSFCDIEGDMIAINQLLNLLDNKDDIDVYRYDGNIDEALSILASSKIVVGSRFHANILGLLLGKTIIPIIYADKTKNVLNDLNFQSLMIDIRNIDEFKIHQLNDDVLNYHLDISDAIKESHKHFERLDGVLNEE